MKKTILLYLSCLLAAGCSQTAQEPVGTDVPGESKNIVLRTRAADLPDIPAQGKPLLPADTSVIPVHAYLGRSYRLGNTIAGDANNLSFPVIDLARLHEARPDIVDVLQSNSADLSQTAYIGSDNEGSCSLLRAKIDDDFALNTEMVAWQRREAMSQLFRPYLSDYGQSVFGELHIEVHANRYALVATSSLCREIGASFLTSGFLDILYNAPLQEVIDAYGLFVISGYYTGGRMTALYYALPGVPQPEEELVKGMRMVMEHSYTWVPNSLVFGREKGNIQATADAFRLGKVCYVLQVQGGRWQPIGGVAQNGTDDFTDLTPWLRSLEDESTHVLAGFREGGLRSLSDFVAEENFRGRINDTHNGYTESTELTVPCIVVMKVWVRSVDGESLYKVAPVLRTRQGDLLILSDGLNQETDAELRANNDDAVFLQRAEAIAADKSRYYRCGIEARPSETLNPVLRIPQNYDISKLDESRMFRWQNPATGMHYVCDPVAKIALSWYGDDTIPATYGLAEWIASLPEGKTTMTALCMSYRIMGL